MRLNYCTVQILERPAKLHWEEIKSSSHSGNACYRSVQMFCCSPLLSKNTKVQIYRTVMLLVVLHGFETWSVIGS